MGLKHCLTSVFGSEGGRPADPRPLIRQRDLDDHNRRHDTRSYRGHDSAGESIELYPMTMIAPQATPAETAAPIRYRMYAGQA